MSGWDRSMLAMSTKEQDVQDAMTALQRLLRQGAVRPTTRVVLDGAMRSLELESELGVDWPAQPGLVDPL